MIELDKNGLYGNGIDHTNNDPIYLRVDIETISKPETKVTVAYFSSLENVKSNKNITVVNSSGSTLPESIPVVIDNTWTPTINEVTELIMNYPVKLAVYYIMELVVVELKKYGVNAMIK